MRRLDLTGRRFGRLVATIREGSDGSGGATWRCRCDCGQGKVISANALNKGRTQSCGCLRRDEMQSRATHGEAAPATRTTEYRIWSAMKDRCGNDKNKHYKNYGGRGITVDQRWLVYESFLKDMGRRPGPGFSIERRDNNIGYSKANCYWATKEAQQNNMRSNRILVHNGTALTVSEWARRLRLNVDKVRGRLHHQWSVSRTLETP